MAILGVGECGHRPVRLEARVQIGQRLCRFPSRHYKLGSSIDLYQRRHAADADCCRVGNSIASGGMPSIE
jgi:hypothetical protein